MKLAFSRENSLHSINQGERWDVIIIGGGAIGLGCALEASLRGYKTLLVEKNDFASGTSSRSSKMIHGGVRYLKQGNLSLVRRALNERNLLARSASSWVKEQRFIIPLYSFAHLAIYAAALRFYDMLAQGGRMMKSGLLSAAMVKQQLPGIDAAGLKGGVAYSDGLFDDARLAIAIALAASRQGAVLLNYASVEGLLKSNERRKAEGVLMRDMRTAREYEIRSRLVINATGVFADTLAAMDQPRSNRLYRVSQGSHLVLPADFLAGKNALLIPRTSDGRVLFCIPWHRRLLVGTTDSEVSQAEEEPHPRAEELNFILDNCARYLDKKPQLI